MLSEDKKKQVRQNRITVNFRMNSAEEQKLFDWVKSNGVISGESAFIKQMLYRVYKEQEGK